MYKFEIMLQYYLKKKDLGRVSSGRSKQTTQCFVWIPLPHFFSAGPMVGRVQASSSLLHFLCCPLCLAQDQTGVQGILLLGLFEVSEPQEKLEVCESWLGSYKQDKHKTLGGSLWGCLSKEKIVTGFHFKNWVLVLFCSVSTMPDTILWK